MALIKGITIEIDGNTKGLNEALKDVNKNISSVSFELKQVDKLLKLDPANIVLMAQKQELLSKAIKETSEKLSTLKEAQRQADEEFSKGKITEEQYRSLTREIAKSEQSLKGLEGQLKNTTGDTNKLEKETEDLTESQKKGTKQTSVFGDVLKANLISEALISGIKAIASAIGKIISSIVDFIKKGVELASNLGEVENVIDTTFGEGADTINKFALSAAGSFGLSELAAKKYTGTMGAILKSMGLTGPEVSDMSMKITGLAGDLASFYNLDGEDAFNKLRSGISGETEPLKQLGINMSVANLEAYALANGITKSYKSMTEAEKVSLRYNYLMQVTADAQGDFAKTSDSLANQQRILSLNFESLSASIGKGLLPAITNLIKPLNEAMVSITSILSDGVQAGDIEQISGIISGLMDNIGSQLNEMLPQLIEFIIPIINSLITSIVNAVPIFIPLLITAAGDLLMGFIGAITSNTQAIMEMVTTLIKTIADFLVNNLANIIQAGIDLLVALVKGVVEALPEIIPQLIAVLIDIVTLLLDNIDLIIETGVEILIALIEGIVASIPMLVEKMPMIIEKIVTALIKLTPQLIIAALAIIIALAKGIITNLPTLLSYMPKLIVAIVKGVMAGMNSIQKTGIALVEGIWEGIKGSFVWIKNKITGWVGDIMKFIKKLFGIASPSKVMKKEVGLNLGLGIAAGIEDSLGAVNNAMGILNSEVIASVNPIINPTANSNPLILQIENFINERKTDVEAFMEEAEFYRRNALLAGGIK